MSYKKSKLLIAAVKHNMSNLSQDTCWTVGDSNPVPCKHTPVFVPPLYQLRRYATTETQYLNNFIIGLALFKLRRAWVCPSSLLFNGFSFQFYLF